MSRAAKVDYIASVLKMDKAIAFVVRTSWKDEQIDYTYRLVKHDVEVGKIKV